MTAQSIMSYRLVKLRSTDLVCDALILMHKHQVRNIPVVNEQDEFIGLFGVRRLSQLLLPKATALGKYSVSDLSFLPDDLGDIKQRFKYAGNKPVSKYLVKKKKLVFCHPETPFPKMLKLLEQSKDASLPVIITGDNNKLVGIVSIWDVFEKLVINLFIDKEEKNPCSSSPV